MNSETSGNRFNAARVVRKQAVRSAGAPEKASLPASPCRTSHLCCLCTVTSASVSSTALGAEVSVQMHTTHLCYHTLAPRRRLHKNEQWPLFTYLTLLGLIPDPV